MLARTDEIVVVKGSDGEGDSGGSLLTSTTSPGSTVNAPRSKHLEGFEIRKVLWVPDRMFNLVV